jgi:hypothetical protein
MEKFVRTILSIKQLCCRGCKRPLKGGASVICVCCGEAYCLDCARVVTAYLALIEAKDQCLVKGWDALVELARQSEIDDPDESLH